MAASTTSTSGRRGDLFEPVLADQQLRALRQAGQSKCVGGRVVGGDHPARPELVRLASPADRAADGPTGPRPASRPSLAAITSSVLRPMLPVEPSTATRLVLGRSSVEIGGRGIDRCQTRESCGNKSVRRSRAPIRSRRSRASRNG